MAVALTLTGKRPNNTQFGLDSFTEIYKCDATADVVLTDPGVPQMAAAHPDYPSMFVVSRYVNESGATASALDITYMGTLTGDLPPGQRTTGTPVQTATTFASDGVTNVTAQFYAVESRYSFISYLSPGSTGSAPAPSGDPTIISFTVGNASFSGGESELLSLFELLETDVIESVEIVADKYWQNTETKTRYYGAILTVCHPFSARAICLFAAGSGYSVSDTLTCTDLSLNTAVMTVSSISGAGAITDFSIVSDDISATIFEVITATGGSGSGASFRFYGA